MVEIIIHYIVHKKFVVILFWSSNETLPYRMAQWPGLSVNYQPPRSVEVCVCVCVRARMCVGGHMRAQSYSSTSPSIFKACYSVTHIHKCIHTHFVCGDLKTCAIQINQVRMVRTITDFRKLDISLVSRIMPMLNFTIHLSL